MLAIIPARGGSKGLPNKNIKLINGKPLIAHTILAALQSKYISHILVSTDCEEIAKVAEAFGAWVPSLRPADLSGDSSKAIDVFKFTLDLLKNEHNLNFSEFIVLQPTSPLRTVQDIDQAIDLFNHTNAESVISYTKESHSIFWHKYLDKDGFISNIFEDDGPINRQDAQATYYPNGAIYILKSELIFSKNTYFSPTSRAYIMPSDRSVDIDTIDDFLYATFLLEKANAYHK